MKILEISPTTLQEASSQEVLSLHHRLHQLWAARFEGRRSESARDSEEGRLTREDVVNAHIFVRDELLRRGFHHREHDSLDRARIAKAAAPSLEQVRRRWEESRDIVLVPGYVSLVGSVVKGKAEPGDLDLLIRSDREDQSLQLQLRNVFDPEKAGHLHYVYNPAGPHGDHVPLYDLVLRRREAWEKQIVKRGEPDEAEKQGLRPFGPAWTPPKPEMAAYTEFFSADEIWGRWAKDRIDEGRTLAVEPKWNGFRAIVEKQGGRVRLWFEGSRDVDRLPNLPGVAEALGKIGGDLILDCDVGIERNGKRLPRPQLATLNAESPELGEDDVVVVTCFDLPYWGHDLHEQPWRERRAKLEDLFRRFLADDPHWRLSPARAAESREELERHLRWAFEQDRSEGAVVKDAESPYELDGATSDWAKIKRVVELKVKVLEVQRNKQGTFSYRGGLRSVEGDSWENTVQVDGRTYVDLGKTFATSARADVGDIITVQIQELIPDEEARTLVWVAPQVIDVDKDREEPYTATQALDLAERGGVLQKAMIEEKWIAKGIRQASGSPGGKRRLAGLITRLIPGHRTYVEPFAGGAAVFFAKEPSEREVLNDKDPEIAFALRFLQKATDEQISALRRRSWVVDRKRWEQVRKMKPQSELDRVYRFLYHRKASFGYSDGQSFDTGSVGRDVSGFLDRLPGIRERMKGVTITSRDALEVIDRYDAPDTFFYLDPPYPGANQEYQVRFDYEDLQRLLDRLGEAKGKWLLSVEPKSIKGLRLPKGVHVRRVMQRRTFTNDMDKFQKMEAELLIANYPLPERIRKQEEDDIPGEGGTRSERAQQFWQETWFRSFPPSGKGRWVYHHHWRGLSEDEVEWGERRLLQTDHSLHGDLRFQFSDDALWGFTIFLGTTEANREAGGDRLIALEPDDKLQGAFKLHQPAEWLRVGMDRPMVVEPGGIGSTSQTYSKFFVVDHGTYEIGVWREHFFEVFLHGQKLKGRYLIQFAPVGEDGRRVWLISRPDDQRPYAETHDLDDVARDVADSGQRWLVWSKPGERPRLIDVRKYLAEMEQEAEEGASQGAEKVELHAEIFKADSKRQIVYGVVMEPYALDTHNEWARPEEIERAALEFMEYSQQIGHQHRPGDIVNASVVESYLAPIDMELPAGHQGKRSVRVRKGTWIMGVKVRDPVIWQMVEKGQLTGFSIQGYAVRRKGAPPADAA